MSRFHRLCRITKRSCSLSAVDRFERFSWFLESCHCSEDEKSIIWKHVDAFESDKDQYRHVEPWFIAQEQMKRIPPPTASQKGCFDIIPNLTARSFWNKSQFKFVKDLEENFAVIQEELLNVLHENNQNQQSHGFQPYTNANDMGATDEGHWNVLYFFLHDLRFQQNMDRFPKTMAMIQDLNGQHGFHHALISCLSPDSHIVAHNGPTNKKLRIYLPLLVEKDSNILRVDEHAVKLKEGQCIVFDDSFVHEAWNKSRTNSRFTLIFDIWHPDLTEEEVDFLARIQRVYEGNLLQIARRNENGVTDENNPYVAMLRVYMNSDSIPR